MYLIVKYLLGGLFFLSALLKLIDFNATATLFRQLLFANETITKLFLSLLILTELTAAYLIVEDFLHNNAIFKLIFIMIFCFLIINVIFYVRGYENCGCFGANVQSAPLISFIKNVLSLIGLLFIKNNRKNSLKTGLTK